MKTLLLSLPWSEYQSPSMPIGHLAAYLKKRGYDVEASYPYVEAAAHIGFAEYSLVSQSHPNRAESVSAYALFKGVKPDISAYLKSSGINVSGASAKLKRSLKRIYDRTVWSDYGLVGFSINHAQLFTSLMLAKWVKQDHPNIKIVFGGRSVSGYLGRAVISDFPQVDWCVDGEGELPLELLIKSMSASEDNAEGAIPGLIYRIGDRVISNGRRQMEELAGFPDPDYDDYFRRIQEAPSLASVDVSPYIPVEVSRGCTYGCGFCADRAYHQGFRTRPANEVARSIDRLCSRYGVPSFYLVTTMITPPMADEIFGRLREHGRDYAIRCAIRSGMTKEKLGLMKDGGVCELQIGIETLSGSLLEKMSKGTCLLDNLQTMKFCEELGIKYVSILMTGFPGETQEDVDEAIEAIDLACAYQPLFELYDYVLLHDSIVHCHMDDYGVMPKVRGRSFMRIMRKVLGHDFPMFVIDHDSAHGTRTYSLLEKRLRRWRDDYNESRISGHPLLYYLDCESYLQIEDSRFKPYSMRLEGWLRDLYLYCDSKRSFESILHKFDAVDKFEIEGALSEMVNSKLMAQDGDEYLSLAIRLSNENRRNYHFL